MREIETVVKLLEVATTHGAREQVQQQAESVDLTLDTAGPESERPIDDVGAFVFFQPGEKWAVAFVRVFVSSVLCCCSCSGCLGTPCPGRGRA